MAAGEYVSVRSQREMFEYRIGLEREELEHYPDEEAEELALIYAARGIELAAGRKMAKAVIADPEKALDTLARKELGLNPEDLGSPCGAALFSFVSFAMGAAIPLLLFLLAGGSGSLLVAIILSATALFGVGGCNFTVHRTPRAGKRYAHAGNRRRGRDGDLAGGPPSRRHARVNRLGCAAWSGQTAIASHRAACARARSTH